MISFKQMLEKAAAENNKAKTSKPQIPVASSDAGSTTGSILNLKHIRSNRQDIFAANSEESEVVCDTIENCSDESDTEQCTGKQQEDNSSSNNNSVRIRPNAEFLSRYVGSRERFNSKADSSSNMSKEDVELTLFRRKGENVLRRIAKYYGYAINITGQDELPEGYLVEIGSNGNKIAAGNDGVIAALVNYKDELQAQIAASSIPATTIAMDISENNVKEAKPNGNKKTRAQRKKSQDTTSQTKQPTLISPPNVETVIPARIVSISTSMDSGPHPNPNQPALVNAKIPQPAVVYIPAENSQFRISPRKKTPADVDSAGTAVTNHTSIITSMTTTSTIEPKPVVKTGFIRLTKSASAAIAAISLSSNGANGVNGTNGGAVAEVAALPTAVSVLGKRAAAPIMGNKIIAVNTAAKRALSDRAEEASGGVPVVVARKVFNINGAINNGSSNSSNSSSSGGGGQQLARKAFLSIKSQI